MNLSSSNNQSDNNSDEIEKLNKDFQNIKVCYKFFQSIEKKYQIYTNLSLYWIKILLKKK